MASLSPIALRTGGPSFLPFSTVLKAGPVSLLLEQGEIRRIRMGGAELLRRIYLAVRGPDWRTIPPALKDLVVDSRPDSFRVSYALVHKQDDFDFTWKVEVEGDPDGTVRFLASGRAGSGFSTNRVGMCVLHPLRECAGRPVRLKGPDGSLREGRFPETIRPDEPFTEFTEFSHQLEDGTWVDLAYRGEVFEMEDQRNWTDGSFKTYCPPQNRPKPRRVEAGWETVQGITLRIPSPAAPASARSRGAESAPDSGPGPGPEEVAVLALGTRAEGALPALGLGLASHGRSLSAKDVERLRALKPAHLRADFRLGDPGLEEQVARASAEAAALGVPLEAAVVVAEDVEGSLAAFADAWSRSGGEVIRWLVFHRKSDSTPAAVFEAAHRRLRGLRPGAAFHLGSKNDFVLLNRGRPDLSAEPAASAGLVYAMCPQVHAFDNRNLVESLEGQEWTLESARALWPDRPLAISTLSIKRTPFAASLKLGGPPPADAWLKQADPRQLSLFGAGWTAASLKRLAGHGVGSATCFETTGPLGVLAGESLAPEERNFPGMDFRLEPGWAYPVYHVLADLAEFTGGRSLELNSSQPLRLDGFAFAEGSRKRILAVNLEEKPVKARIDGLPGSVQVKRLDDRTAMAAVSDAEAYRGQAGTPGATQAGSLELVFAPFELVRIDFAG
jgi:hypothetical protein